MEFQKEFVEYLIVNGITAPEWEKMKQEQADEAVKIIGLFSDVILEGTMRKVDFLEIRLPKEVQCFQCLKDKLNLMVMTAPESSDIDFTDGAGLMAAMTDPPVGIEVFSAERKYQGERELELYELTTQGAVISDGKLFKALAMAVADEQ